jgi:hypothetical protein
MDTEKAKQPEQPTQGNGTGKSDELQDEFINTGRIGRRNALHDILDESHSETTTADLPLKLSALTTNGEWTGWHCHMSTLLTALFMEQLQNEFYKTR